jgi:hypothetical protein
LRERSRKATNFETKLNTKVRSEFTSEMSNGVHLALASAKMLIKCSLIVLTSFSNSCAMSACVIIQRERVLTRRRRGRGDDCGIQVY